MEPIIAALLSVLLPGLGQMLVGQTTKGVVMLVAAAAISGILLIGGLFIIIPCCLIPFVPIIPAIDGFLIAKKLKEGQSVGEWDFF